MHMSEVDTASRHRPISSDSIAAFQSVAAWIPAEVPIILEALLDGAQGELETEVQNACEALNVAAMRS